MEYFTPWVTERYLLIPHRRCRKSCQASITPLKATGADWLQSRSLRPLQRFRSKLLATGSSGKPFGRYMPAPQHIPWPMFDEDSPTVVHQADLLYLPHDRVDRSTYKFALTVVDVALSYKEAESLTDKLPLRLVASTSEGLSLGLDFCSLTRDVSSWAHSASCWRNIMYRFGAALPITTASKGSWNGLTGPWQLAERLFGHQ